jgi:hypothetical protein
MNLPLNNHRRKSLEYILVEFNNLILAAMEQSLFESTDALVLEEKLVLSETSLAAAKGSIDAMRRIWPSGEDAYSRFYEAISELMLRRQYMEEWVSCFSVEISQSEFAQKTSEVIAKNRETIMVAVANLEEGSDILYKKTGIRIIPNTRQE